MTPKRVGRMYTRRRPNATGGVSMPCRRRAQRRTRPAMAFDRTFVDIRRAKLIVRIQTFGYSLHTREDITEYSYEVPAHHGARQRPGSLARFLLQQAWPQGTETHGERQGPLYARVPRRAGR